MSDDDMTFADLDIQDDIVAKLEEDGITHPTEVQRKSVPHIRAGEDVMAESETGSGKTLAFGLPILEQVSGDRTQALILSPTRELAKQIAKEFNRYGPDDMEVVTIYGGVSYEPQIEGAKTANIVVGTPGRVLDLLEQGKLDVSEIDWFVLDEADRMLDMGFQDELEGIMRHCPADRQDLLFGATIPRNLKNLVEKYRIDPVTVRVEREKHTRNLQEKYLDVQSNRKLSALYTLLKDRERDLSLVFCRTKDTTRFVAKVLRANGINAQELNGDMSQHQREELVDRFKDMDDDDVQVVVATDVAARGLHIDNITHVFNYDVPDTADTYTHRIGRAGRQGADGEAVTLLEKDDHNLFRKITRHHKDIEKMDRDALNLDDVTIPQHH